MKIIQVVSTIKSTHWGGIESVAVECSKIFQNAGHSTTIYSAPKISSICEKSIQNVPIKRLLPFPPYILDFKKKPDIIHWHQGQVMAHLSMKMAKFYNIPYLATLHGAVDSVAPLKINGQPSVSNIRAKMKSFYENAYALLAVGQDEYKIAKDIFPNHNVLYFPNGVNLSHFENKDKTRFRYIYSIPKEAKLILCLSRIDHLKNQLLLLRSIAQINSVYKRNLYLAIIGKLSDPAYYELLKKEAQFLRLEKNIRFITDINPFMSEHAGAYAAADLFVLPSLHEAFGIVILEAWASKKPVIASNVGGIPYLIKDNQTGLLFETNNQNDLSQKILQLLDDTNLANQVALEGYKKVYQEYRWENICKRLEKLYQDAISSLKS